MSKILFSKLAEDYFHKSNDALFLVNPDTGLIIESNLSAALFTGHNAEALLKMELQQLLDSGGLVKYEQTSNLTGGCRFTAKLLVKSGSLLDVEVTIHMLGDVYLCVIRDISSQLEYISTNERLISIIDKTSDAIAISNTQGVIEYLNPAGRRLLNYIDKNLKDTNVSEHATEQTKLVLQNEGIPTAIKTGKWQGKSSFHTPLGIVDTSHTLVCHKNSKGNIEFFSSILRDISREHKAQKIINRSYHLLEKAEEIAQLGSWQFNYEKQKSTWSEGLYKILNYPKRLTPEIKHYLTLVDERDIDKVKQAVNFDNADSFDFTHRIKLINGQMKWIRAMGSVEKDDDGNHIRATGVIQDITTRKIQAKALELAQNVFDHTTEAVMVSNAKNQIIRVNKAFEDITGYSLGEIQGKNPSLLSSNKHDVDFYQNMWESLNETGTWQGEIWNRRKNGEIYPEWLTIDTIFDENGELLNRVAIFSDISFQKKQEEFIKHQANFDALTDLPNRTLLHDRLNNSIKYSLRHNTEFAVLFIDLDMFKSINDTYGHHIGDKVLVEAAKRLKQTVRKSDTVSRFSGDEFVILANEINSAKGAEHVAQAIIKVMQEPIFLDNLKLHISASVGIALFPTDSKEIDELLSLADQAMYFSKALGRSQYQFFTKKLAEKSARRIQLKEALIYGIENNELYNAYQPIFELSTGKVVKFEVLARWYSSILDEQISPIEFIGIAEDFGLIEEVGEQIATMALRDIKVINAHYLQDFSIAINRSVREFSGSKQNIKKLEVLVEESGIPANWLTVEITESLLSDNHTEQAKKLNYWRDIGASTAIDDFGTGYSSLSYLTQYPIDLVKIDQSFINNLNPKNIKIIDAIISLSHSLGLKTIAEGIETLEQYNLLKSLGSDMGQGYYISKPLIYDDLCLFLNRL
ncbi:EAL domain-containing protein [Catenovulum maritimum]|uniref:sensor domain-containing protein n=1 Tax=Catenovulum maritimum TaxID=1513271 RepID=UPI0006617BCA|nr:EAL domain-containing protein [Catenovulum maritimum]